MRGAPPTVCKVPSLLHQTLANAKKLLAKANCALGKQKKAKKPRSTRGLSYGITAQSVPANRAYARGTKVNITLGWFKPAAKKPKKK
jgi:beta-lactam-binding protein with PASTA domain